MKRQRKIQLLSSLLVVFLLLGGCSGGGSGEKSPSPEGPSDSGGGGTDKQIQIGLIVPGNVNDNGWCASAYEGLLAIESAYGATVNYIENVGMSDIESQLINYGEAGYDIVFCHGFEYTDAVKNVAPRYPDTWYALNSAEEVQAPNVLSVNQNNLEKGYLAGIVAGLVTQSNIIGAIGGTDIPAVQLSVDGVELGAKYVNPDVTVIKTITGDNEDTTAALEVANAMANQGADVLIPVLGSAGLATITVAQEQGILVVGTNSDMHEFGPDVVVSSSVAGFTDSMPAVVQQMLDGTLEAKIYDFGIADGVVKLAPFYDFEDTLPPETLERVRQVVADIEAGTLTVTKTS